MDGMTDEEIDMAIGYKVGTIYIVIYFYVEFRSFTMGSI